MKKTAAVKIILGETTEIRWDMKHFSARRRET